MSYIPQELIVLQVEKGAIDGVAPLNGSSKIDTSYLPSYVDDVESYANLAAFPVSGETSKIYVAEDTDKLYRWSGAAYFEVSVDVMEDTTSMGSLINGATEKAIPVNADMIGVMDSAAGNILKKLSWANIKATLKTYFDTLYNLYVHPNHSGDVTSVADGATTIANNVVTNAKLAQVDTATFKGRTTAGTGNAEDLTVAQAKTLLGISDVIVNGTPIAAVKTIIVSTTGQAATTKTLDLTSLSLTTIHGVQASVKRNSETIGDFGVVTIVSYTATTITYMVATSNTSSVFDAEGLELDSTTNYEVTFLIHAT